MSASKLKIHSSEKSFNEPKEFTSQVKRVMESKKYLEGDKKLKRDLLGAIIFNYTVKIADQQAAPKITGMLLGLDAQDFDLTLSNYDLFQAKVHEALKLIASKNRGIITSSTSVVGPISQQRGAVSGIAGHSPSHHYRLINSSFNSSTQRVAHTERSSAGNLILYDDSHSERSQSMIPDTSVQSN